MLRLCRGSKRYVTETSVHACKFQTSYRLVAKSTTKWMTTTDFSFERYFAQQVVGELDARDLRIVVSYLFSLTCFGCALRSILRDARCTLYIVHPSARFMEVPSSHLHLISFHRPNPLQHHTFEHKVFPCLLLLPFFRPLLL